MGPSVRALYKCLILLLFLHLPKLRKMWLHARNCAWFSLFSPILYELSENFVISCMWLITQNTKHCLQLFYQLCQYCTVTLSSFFLSMLSLIIPLLVDTTDKSSDKHSFWSGFSGWSVGCWPPAAESPDQPHRVVIWTWAR